MYCFVQTYQRSKGQAAALTTHSLDYILNVAPVIARKLQLSEIDSESKSEALYLVSLDTFEKVFSQQFIKKMQKKGVLDYYPNGIKCQNSDCISLDLIDKYPIFKKEVYLKYGIPYDEYKYKIKVKRGQKWKKEN